ncbi:MAG: right-handed parallel beta-helix repeat-containing protein [Melioribacteraceae bacterium]|nr:right-handed parallel beta-helix repeat-containing protein [Melioribacteraceae bacterium]
MKFYFTILLFLTLVFGTISAEDSTIELYVSTLGNNSWSGTLADPNFEKTDGPFATLERAQLEVRNIKNGSEQSEKIVVYIRGGDYFLGNTLLFNYHDSGSKDFPVTYKDMPNEKPVISGGKLISNWKKENGNIWTTQIESGLNFRQLFINGDRRYRARIPSKGLYEIEENPDSDPKAKYNTPANKFKYAEGDLDPQWTNLDDIEIIVLHLWVDAHLRVKSIDASSRIVEFQNSSRRKLEDEGKPARYYIDNVFEGMDEPGEWYYNRQTGKLFYLAEVDEDLNSASVVIPYLKQIIRIEGNPEENEIVHDIQFSGLSFQHTCWQLEQNDAGDLQAASSVAGGIYIQGAERINIEKCEIKNMGTYGIEFANGSKNNRIHHCEISALGGGGIRLSGSAAADDTINSTGNITIIDNHLHDLGQIWHSGDGVLLQHSGNNLIAHNHIHHLYYTGISVGWVWGYKPSVSVNNIIEYNHIHDIGQNLLSDMGAIYLLGVSHGTIVRNNLVHNIQSFSYGGWGLYTDEGSSNIVLENNIVYRTKNAGFHQHYGRENIIRNNVFAYGNKAQIQRTRNEDHLSFTYKHNIIYWEDSELLAGNWEGNDHFKLDSNLYFRRDKDEIKFKEWNFSEWKNLGQDVHSKIDDPLFCDPDKYDFDMKKNSPAYKLGFKPIDMTDVGPRFWPKEVKDIRYLSKADNTEQPALFYNSGSKKKKPLLVGLHTWSSQYKQFDSTPYAKWSIQKDWVFISPNFRGPNKRPEATGSELVINDIISAVEYAKANADVDTNRIYLIGWSGGGYASLIMAAKAPEIWAGISVWAPLSDLEQWYYECMERKNKYAGDLVASCGGRPDENEKIAEEYYKRSPIHFLKNAKKINIDINEGIFDGHKGSVPISHSLNAFNELALEDDRLSKENIDYFVSEAKVPKNLQGRYFDCYYGSKKVLFRRESNNARVTIFNGGHDLIPNAALHWLEMQKK